MRRFNTDTMERLEDGITSRKTAIAIFIIISVAFTSPIYHNINYLGMHDMDEATFYVAVPRETILTHHQIPLWNPYQCGGQVLLASPQSVFLSPTFIINLIFGDIIGIKVKILAYLFIGLYGMFELAKHMQIKGVSTYLPPFIFMLNSVYPLNISEGQLIFPMAYIPWAVLFYLKSSERKYIVYSAMVLALMLLEGGAYFFMYTLLFMGVYGAFTDLGTRKPDNIKKTIAITLLALLFSSVKLLPAIEFIKEYPHALKDYSGYSITSFVHGIFERDQKLPSPLYLSDAKGFFFGISWYWTENGMYTGFLPLALYLRGFLTLRKSHKPLLATSLIFLWLSFGHRAPLSLYEALHALPVLESLRIATRFRTPFLLTLALIAGLTASRVSASRENHGRLRKILVLCALATIIVGGSTLMFWHFKDVVFDIGERIYALEEHAHEFSFFQDAVERIYSKIILNLEIISALSLTATLLAYMRVSGKITSTQFRYILAYGITIFVLCDLMVVNSPIFSDAFIFPPFNLEKGASFFQTENITIENNYSSEYFKFGEFFHQMRGNQSFRGTLERMSYSSMYINFLQNLGSVSCINPMGVKIFAIPRESKGYKGEAYLLNGKGNVTITYFSPNKVAVKFRTESEDSLVINQNYFKGWRVKGNRFNKVEPKNGLLSTVVEPDETEVIFYYLPASFILGAVISSVSLCICLFVLGRLKGVIP